MRLLPALLTFAVAANAIADPRLPSKFGLDPERRAILLKWYESRTPIPLPEKNYDTFYFSLFTARLLAGRTSGTVDATQLSGTLICHATDATGAPVVPAADREAFAECVDTTAPESPERASPIVPGPESLMIRVYPGLPFAMGSEDLHRPWPGNDLFGMRAVCRGPNIEDLRCRFEKASSRKLTLEVAGELVLDGAHAGAIECAGQGPHEVKCSSTPASPAEGWRHWWWGSLPVTYRDIAIDARTALRNYHATPGLDAWYLVDRLGGPLNDPTKPAGLREFSFHPEHSHRLNLNLENE